MAIEQICGLPLSTHFPEIKEDVGFLCQAVLELLKLDLYMDVFHHHVLVYLASVE
jgi:hypothetical protein